MTKFVEFESLGKSIHVNDKQDVYVDGKKVHLPWTFPANVTRPKVNAKKFKCKAPISLP